MKKRKSRDTHGRRANRPYHIPPRGWWRVLVRVFHDSQRDNISVVAAGCAFFAVFAMFPAISALVSIYVLWADPATVEAHLSILESFLPPQAYAIVLEQTRRIVSGAGAELGWGLGVSVVIALWSANRGTETLITALNVAYEEREERSWYVVRARNMGFTLAGIIAVAIAMTALVYVPILFALAGLPETVETYVKMLRWPLLGAVIIAGLAVLYKYGPSRRAAKWHWVSVGSVLATILWLAGSAAFSLYVEHFADYSRFYGSLGAVIVLLFWLYLSFFVILLGAEINAQLEHQTEYDTTIGAARPLGERKAWVADHVADD